MGETMPLLKRDDILQAPDLMTEEIEVPEWGGTVRVRGLTGTERDQFENSVVEMRGKKVQVEMHNIRAKLAALSIVDENGRRLFSDADVEALGGKSASALDRVFSAAQRLSGLSTTDIVELAKN
jgi:hypothetical protein